MPTDDELGPQTGTALLRLAQLRLKDHTPQSALQEVADLARQTVPGADAVSVTLVIGDRADTMAFTDDMALALDERQYERGSGPCLDAARSGEVRRIDDMSTEARWGNYPHAASAAGAQSSLSIPIPIGKSPAVSAALNMYSVSPCGFDEAATEGATELGLLAAATLANVQELHGARQLAEQLTQALESRPVIDQAKGILMRDRGCTAEEAFDLLVSASQRTNRKLRTIAQDIVTATGRPTGPAPR
jgi:GAF domain-containing protein